MEYYILGAIAFVVGLYLFMSYMIYRKAFLINPNEDYKVVNQEDPFFNESYLWYQKIPKEEITLKSYDNQKLKGIYIPSVDGTSTNLAIIVHGYHACSDDMIIIAKMYSDFGFKVLLINQRGHHGSEGKFLSFGHYEKYDLKKWIQFALRTYGSNDKILLHGVSMGAATILLTLGLNIPENVKFAVCDSGYSSLIKMMKVMLKPKVLWAFIPGLSLITYLSNRYFLESVNPKRAMTHSKVPLLIIHGQKDEMVPYEMAEDMIKVSESPYKDLYPVPEADHGRGYVFDKEGIEWFLNDKLKKYFSIKKNFYKEKR